MNLKQFLLKLLPKPQPKKLSTVGSGKSYEEIYNDIGRFEYHDDGFTVHLELLSKTIRWEDITELNVYKTDLMTTDRIDMEIVYGDRYIVIDEELPGWHQFNIRLNQKIEVTPKDWEWQIVQPPFATNYTTIYRKQ